MEQGYSSDRSSGSSTGSIIFLNCCVSKEVGVSPLGRVEQGLGLAWVRGRTMVSGSGLAEEAMELFHLVSEVPTLHGSQVLGDCAGPFTGCPFDGTMGGGWFCLPTPGLNS